jgi:hypothetical protein
LVIIYIALSVIIKEAQSQQFSHYVILTVQQIKKTLVFQPRLDVWGVLNIYFFVVLTTSHLDEVVLKITFWLSFSTTA